MLLINKKKGTKRIDEYKKGGHRFDSSILKHNQLLQGSVYNRAEQGDYRQSQSSNEKAKNSHRTETSALDAQRLVKTQILIDRCLFFFFFFFLVYRHFRNKALSFVSWSSNFSSFF